MLLLRDVTVNKLILCTTGTSVANSCPSLRKAQGHRTRWEEDLPVFADEIEKKIHSLENDYKDRDKRRALSAELNTLDRIDLGSNDRIILIATDSAPGRICSEALKKIIEEIYDSTVEIKRIIGLQVYDEKDLREKGLKNLVKTILDEYLANDEIRYSYDIIINPTGGYKGIVPFLTVMGMMYGKSSLYLFEFSDELIHLPPLPLTFDLAIYERVKDALGFVENEIAVTVEAFLSKVADFDPLERDLFLSFTEPYDDDLITLSPLAFILLKIEESGERCMVSETVQKKLESLKDEKRVIMERLITSAANPLWRHQTAHRWPSSKFLILKQGNTSERLAGFMRNGVFHVALAFPNHGEYEKELGKYTIEDFDNKQFIEWAPQVIEEAELSDYDLLQRKYDQMMLRNKKLSDNNELQQKNIRRLKKQLEALRQRMSDSSGLCRIKKNLKKKKPYFIGKLKH